jgi:uncharacterized protein
MSTFSREFYVKSDSERLRVTIDGPAEGVSPRVLSLHGAGPSNRTRTNYLAAHLARMGWGTVRFDFSGHGDSSGTMNASSITKRIREASLIATYLDGASSPVLIGTSMGGHVAARLSETLRPSHLILFCPAAYGQSTEDIAFGPTFTEAIRQSESYFDSLAYRSLAQYGGRLTIIIGANDEIIPGEVIDRYMAAAQRVRSVRLERIADAPHQIHGWAMKRPEVERLILSVLDDELRR